MRDENWIPPTALDDVLASSRKRLNITPEEIAEWKAEGVRRWESIIVRIAESNDVRVPGGAPKHIDAKIAELRKAMGKQPAELEETA